MAGIFYEKNHIHCGFNLDYLSKHILCVELSQRQQRTKRARLSNRKGFFHTGLDLSIVERDAWGVYVPVTKDTQPNPYLNDPLRDIEVNKNLKLTKVNPSFMTRQIAEIAAKREGIHFHLTSLRPIRPENGPTPREEIALKAFEKGTQEIGQIVDDESNKTFFIWLR